MTKMIIQNTKNFGVSEFFRIFIQIPDPNCPLIWNDIFFYHLNFFAGMS